MILTRMYSDDGLREAHVIRVGKQLLVDMFQRNKQEKLESVRCVDVTGHSEHYAEDAAENWVTYVIRN
jgi:hypothetical protein